MVTAQTVMRRVFEARFTELRSMVEKAAQSSLTMPSRSKSGASRPETSRAGKSRIVQIQPMMISLPTRVEVAEVGPIEIDLVHVPLKTLNLVQREVAAELKKESRRRIEQMKSCRRQPEN